MEVILISVYSAIFIFVSVFFLIKAFNTVYKRNEMSRKKFIAFSVSAIAIGVIVASILPFVYKEIFGYIS